MAGRFYGSDKGYEFDPVSQRIIGAAMTVHRQLGTGFVEYTYQKALAIEFQHLGIAFQREVEIPIYYRGEMIDTRRADFVVAEMILELKATECPIPEHVAQLAMYLKAARYKSGLLFNIGTPKLFIKRVANSALLSDPSCPSRLVLSHDRGVISA
jgi:GxxExxY protein